VKSFLKFSESSKIIFIAVAFLICINVYSQFPDTAFIRTFGGPNMDVGRDIQNTTDGGFIIAGTTSSFGSGNTALYLIKTDSNGIHQWSKAIGGIGIEWGFSVKQTFDKGYVAAGYTNSFGSGGYDIYLVKTDSIGNTLWEKTYGGSDWDFSYAVLQTQDSGFVLCGSTYSFGNGNEDVYVVKTNKNGDTLWTRTFGGSGKDVGYSIIQYDDSKLVIAGETNSFGNGGSDIYFLSFNESGNLISQKTFGSTKNDKAYYIEKTSDGGMVMMGETDSITAGNIEALIIKISSNDIMQWQHIHPGGLGGSAMNVQMLNSGGWWIPGTGMELGGTGDEEGYSFVITPTNEVAFIGSTTSYGQGQQDVFFVKMKSDSIAGPYNPIINEFNDTTLSPLAVPEYYKRKNVQIYPNPFCESAVLIIENWSTLQTKSAELKIYDLLGREIQKSEIRNQKSEISRGNMNEGLYFFTISSNNEIISAGKLVIQ